MRKATTFVVFEVGDRYLTQTKEGDDLLSHIEELYRRRLAAAMMGWQWQQLGDDSEQIEGDDCQK